MLTQRISYKECFKQAAEYCGECKSLPECAEVEDRRASGLFKNKEEFTEKAMNELQRVMNGFKDGDLYKEIAKKALDVCINCEEKSETIISFLRKRGIIE